MGAIGMLAQMQQLGLQADVVSYNSALSTCGRAAEWQAALQLFATMRETSVTTDSITHSEVLMACESAGQWAVAMDVAASLQELERRISEDQQDLSFNVATYLEIQQESSAAVAANSRQRSEGLGYYIGSPLVALSLLRPFDKAILLEESGTEHEKLQNYVARLHHQLTNDDGGLEVIHTDCYEWMRWPFLLRMSVGGDRRGLVFIDPPYHSRSVSDTWNLLMIRSIRHHWPGSCVVLWYPANNHDRTRILHRRILQLNLGEVLVVEASVDAAFTFEANLGANVRAASGLLIIAPPEGLRSDLKDTLASIRHLLAISKVSSYGGNDGFGTSSFTMFDL